MVEGIGFLCDVLRRMDRHQHKKTPRMGRLNAWRIGALAAPDPTPEADTAEPAAR